MDAQRHCVTGHDAAFSVVCYEAYAFFASPACFWCQVGRVSGNVDCDMFCFCCAECELVIVGVFEVVAEVKVVDHVLLPGLWRDSARDLRLR